MERSKKYHSNHFSSEQNVDRSSFHQHQQNFPHSRIIQRQQPTKSFSSLINSQKQNNILPYGNEYSYLNRYKKLDRFMDMENYFNNLYGQKKQKRLQKQKESQREKILKEKLTLPSIYQRQNQQLAFQKEMMRMKMEHLQARLNKIEPLYIVDYNRLPPINGLRCNCGQNHAHNHAENQPFNSPNNKVNKSGNFSGSAPNQRRKKLLRKFRIYGIAIFFMTLFPHYSFLFGHFKLKEFLEKYLVEQNQVIRSMNEKLIQKFKEIPLYQEIRMIHDQYDQQRKQLLALQTTSGKRREQDPKIKISNQGSNQNYIVNLGIFKRIVLMIIKMFDELVDGLDEEMYEFLAIGTLNTSYYGDEVFAVEEMPFIYCDLQKGNIKLTKDQERALLLSNFLIKKVIYQYLVRLAVDSQWHEELSSFSSLKKKEVTFFKLICKELELCSFFLYQLSIKNFYDLIETEQPGNFLEQSDSSLPLPLKTMRFPSLFMSQSQKQIFNHGFDLITNKMLNENKQNSKSFQTLKPKSKQSLNSEFSKKNLQRQKFESKYDWSKQQEEIFEQYNLLIQQDPLNLIHNSFQFSQLSKIISQYMKSSYDKAQKSVMKILQKLRVKVMEKRRKNYMKIHQKVLKKKFILTKQHQILQGVIFLRGNLQKKLVSISRRMLEIYVDVLAKNEIDAGDDKSELVQKRDKIQKKNSQVMSNNSMISILSNQKQGKSSIDSQSQFYGRKGKIVK